MLTGFPWCLLGHSQYGQILLIQMADLAGVYGIFLLVALCNGLIHRALFDRPSFRTAPGEPWRRPLCSCWSRHRSSMAGTMCRGTREVAGQWPAFRVAVVQGNIDQSLKWNPEYQEKTIRIYETLTRQAAPFKPDLVLWPETAVPFFFQENTRPLPQGRGKRRGSQGPPHLRKPCLLVCRTESPDFTTGPISSPPRAGSQDHYDKIHLVPFGEYVPLQRFLPFVHRLVPAAGDFAPGKG